MTDEEIDAMEAGREMDRLIHARIFGQRSLYEGLDPEYSTDIAAAWQILEKFHREESLGDFCEHSYLCDGTPWDWCGLSAEQMAVHICRAALKCCKSVAEKEKDATKASVNS